MSVESKQKVFACFLVVLALGVSFICLMKILHMNTIQVCLSVVSEKSGLSLECINKALAIGGYFFYPAIAWGVLFYSLRQWPPANENKNWRLIKNISKCLGFLFLVLFGLSILPATLIVLIYFVGAIFILSLWLIAAVVYFLPKLILSWLGF